ncbi:MAG TPA: hypothetical protein VKB93_19260 [Thermoanaerobaculia bacterium]|nr:hypothetical protein [Thermoanaerobaculia bacterium]
MIALLFCLAAVPLQQKASVAAPFCKTTEEHEQKHGTKHHGHRVHRDHDDHQRAHPNHQQQHQQHHVHIPPAVNVPARAATVQPIAPVATLKLDAFDTPSPLSVAEAEKAKRAIHR